MPPIISESRLQKILSHFEFVQAKLNESPQQSELVALSTREASELNIEPRSVLYLSNLLQSPKGVLKPALFNCLNASLK